MKLIRNLLGEIIIFFDWLFSPKRIKRDEQAQLAVDEQLKSFSLYQFRACPFCVKVKRYLKAGNLRSMELKDASNDPQARSELEQGGGRIKVPCLRIQEDGKDEWMYESSDIIAYLKERFPDTQTPA